MLRFDGRVVIVTGAARGIGRAHAELLASRGAAVIVNDLGTAIDGTGHDASAAESVASALRSAGGRAEADTHDVSDPAGAQALADHALSTYGRIDAVVNNAGIYHTDAFPDLGWETVQRLLAVHVGGSFLVTQACWPHLAASGAGRVVLTTSTGALGRHDLVAYGTAKAAVLGLARALATVSEPFGIRVNAVAPMGMSRMMGYTRFHGADPAPDPDRDPRLVAPTIALLCHESCPVNGETFVAGQRRQSRLVLAETDGFVHPHLDLAPEDVLARWDAVVDPTRLQIVSDTMHWSARNTALIDAATPSTDG